MFKIGDKVQMKVGNNSVDGEVTKVWDSGACNVTWEETKILYLIEYTHQNLITMVD